MSDKVREATREAEESVARREAEKAARERGEDPHAGKSPAELAKLVRRR